MHRGPVRDHRWLTPTARSRRRSTVRPGTATTDVGDPVSPRGVDVTRDPVVDAGWSIRWVLSVATHWPSLTQRDGESSRRLLRPGGVAVRTHADLQRPTDCGQTGRQRLRGRTRSRPRAVIRPSRVVIDPRPCSERGRTPTTHSTWWQVHRRRPRPRRITGVTGRRRDGFGGVVLGQLPRRVKLVGGARLEEGVRAWPGGVACVRRPGSGCGFSTCGV
jgi:hypothetical protein